MADDKAAAPAPIIKKIKKVSGGHHGGAWKVAYADFVTAMMAFFLLLWLLSSTSEEQKEGIAEYFTPTTGLRDQQGIGFQGGTSPTEDGTKKSDKTPVAIVVGQAPPGTTEKADKTEQEIEKEVEKEVEKDKETFDKAEEELKKALEEDPNLRDFKDSILFEQTPEGLKIQILDLDKNPMFEPGSARLTAFGERVLRKMADIIAITPNHISITGHTDSVVLTRGGQAYTNWELSADRANASRRFFLTASMEPARIMKVVGMADKEPLVPENTASPKNRRISVILLRGAYLKGFDANAPAPRSLLSVPKIDNTKSAPKPKAPPAAPAPTPIEIPSGAPPSPPSKTAPLRPISSMPSGLIREEE